MAGPQTKHPLPLLTLTPGRGPQRWQLDGELVTLVGGHAAFSSCQGRPGPQAPRSLSSAASVPSGSLSLREPLRLPGLMVLILSTHLPEHTLAVQAKQDWASESPSPGLHAPFTTRDPTVLKTPKIFT